MEIKIINQSDVARCPIGSLLASHYYDDGSCKCEKLTLSEHDWDALCEALERPTRVLPRLREFLEEEHSEME